LSSKKLSSKKSSKGKATGQVAKKPMKVSSEDAHYVLVGEPLPEKLGSLQHSWEDVNEQ